MCVGGDIVGKHLGKCALCGKECELTFEHIPPRAAFNSKPARPVSGFELLTEKNLNGSERMPWDTEGLRYQNQQQGMGRYSLCKVCNNNTGSWYGDAYVFFANVVHAAISSCSDDDSEGITILDVYPLRFIKQILSMFCSTSDPDNSLLQPIREFVLDKDAVGIDKRRYKLCMYFTKSSVYKQTGIMVSAKWTQIGLELMTLAEITAYPLGFILYFDPSDTWDFQGTDITSFSDCGYNDRGNVSLPWKIKEMNDLFPEAYRAKEEIQKRFEENKEKE